MYQGSTVNIDWLYYILRIIDYIRTHKLAVSYSEGMAIEMYFPRRWQQRMASLATLSHTSCVCHVDLLCHVVGNCVSV